MFYVIVDNIITGAFELFNFFFQIERSQTLLFYKNSYVDFKNKNKVLNYLDLTQKVIIMEQEYRSIM